MWLCERNTVEINTQRLNENSNQILTASDIREALGWRVEARRCDRFGSLNTKIRLPGPGVQRHPARLNLSR